MNDLRRELAPVTEDAWKYLEEEVSRSLKVALSARKIVDFSGPHGWDYSAVNLGRAGPADRTFVKNVESRVRMVQPLVELRAGFELLREDLDSISRGARDINIQPAVDAALQLAYAEDKMVYYGHPAAAVEGICKATPHQPLELPAEYPDYPEAVADATEVLRVAGVPGPYAMALDSAGYTGLSRATIDGFPVLFHAKRLLKGPVIYAPALTGAVVASIRGGDFELVAGRDIAIGYRDHDETKVRLYLEESITFRALAPEAAVCLKYPSA